MSEIALQAEITRKELRELQEQSGPDSTEVQQMRAVALEWISELQEDHRLAGIVPQAKSA
jgi:hypothetical protein